MQIISGTTEFELNGEYAVTIGKFDGIHRGHRELLDRIVGLHNSKNFKEAEIKSAVFTFDKSPAEFFSGKKIPALTIPEEKHKIFEYLGIDVLVEFPFNAETAATPPESFIKDILIDKLHAKYIVAGADASFGEGGTGNSDLLINLASKYGYKCEIVDKLIIDGEEVSSTIIRQYVKDGNMEKAHELIGVPYAVRGICVRGNQIGRTIGFPTVNVEITKDKLMPPFGVYFTEITVDGEYYKGITNIGTKPTITDEDTVFAETNILDFNADAYGKSVNVKLLHFQRPEKKFENIDELKKQIARDITNGKEYFGK